MLINLINNLQNFRADELSGFLVSNSLVGLGLILAIFAFISPILKPLFEKRKIELDNLIESRDEIYKKMGDSRGDLTLSKQYQKLIKQIKYLKKIPKHYEKGYQVPLVFFSYSLILSIINIASPNSEYVLFSFMTFIFGLVFFIINLFYMFGDIKEYTLEKFQKILEEDIVNAKKVINK